MQKLLSMKKVSINTRTWLAPNSSSNFKISDRSFYHFLVDQLSLTIIIKGEKNMSKLTWLLQPLEAQLLWFLMHLWCLPMLPLTPHPQAFNGFALFVLYPVEQKITCTDCGNWLTQLVPQNTKRELKSTSEKCVGWRWAGRGCLHPRLRGSMAAAVSGDGSIC